MDAVVELIELSNEVAYRIDIIQGPGGNTSVKLDDGTMLIKASGKNLKDIATENAYTIVDVAKILTTLKNDSIDITNNEDIEKINLVVKDAKIGENTLRPSMETSFHCFFSKYVLHTHNVYANIFLCSDQYEQLETCFTGNENYTISLLNDYYTPGAELSWHIYDSFRFNEIMPNVVFLPNHGVIYSHSNLQELLKIHQDVESKLLYLLQINKSNYPTFQLTEKEDQFICNSDYLTNKLIDENSGWIFKELLFPDQAIYIKANDFSFDNDKSKVYVNKINAEVVFNCSKNEASTISELLIACFFIMDIIKEKNFEPLTINYDWEKLTGMSSEQYRKNLLK